MPLVSLTTNSPELDSHRGELLHALSGTVAAMLGKPERYVMVKVEQNPDMLFAGTDAPAAYVELKSIGLPADKARTFSAELCRVIADGIGVAPDRIYIEFSDAPRQLWGWNSGTF